MPEELEKQKETQQIQKAIEQVMEDETSTLPLLPALEVDTEPAADTALPKREEQAQIHSWFFTFMCMNIPIAGWGYLLYLAFNKRVTDRRTFARAYLYYKLIFLIVSLVILGILVVIGLEALDQLLAYMEML